MQWFDVDKAGLAKLLARRGKEFIVFELVQNAWDENTSKVTITLERISGTKYARLIVEDDNPEGFANLSHAFTLFAESTKKGDAEKRGRFNLGEKLVLAVCEKASISSTKGTIVFDENGRSTKRLKRECGSIFDGVLRMTNEEIEECGKGIHRLIPPANIVTTYNGETLVTPKFTRFTEEALPTDVADEEGFLRRRTRKTTIDIYTPKPGDPAMIYEMGIPIVETGDRYSVNIMQKVPLNLDRDNVNPAYLSLIRSIVLRMVDEELTVADVNSTWVKDAIENHGDDLPESTIQEIAELKFGRFRVAYDPSDPEANKLAVAKGYTVVHGNTLSKAEWSAMKRFDAILPAGQVTPSPKPYSEDGKPMNIVPRDKWTPEMVQAVEYLHRLTPHLIGTDITIQITNDIAWPFAATYGRRELTLNLGRLGHKWFVNRQDINRLLIHELGHHYSGDHLSSAFHDALCDLGSKLCELALDRKTIFWQAATAQ